MATLKLIQNLALLFLAFVKWYRDQKAEDRAKFIQDAHAAFSREKVAVSPEEYEQSAKDIQDIITRL